MNLHREAPIRAYQDVEEGRIYLTDGRTCWDMTPTIGYRSLAVFMTELPHNGGKDWPMRSRPWSDYHQQVETEKFDLVAELRNPGNEDETLTVKTMIIDDFTMDAFLIIDTNPNTWQELVAGAMRKEEAEVKAAS